MAPEASLVDIYLRHQPKARNVPHGIMAVAATDVGSFMDRRHPMYAITARMAVQALAVLDLDWISARSRKSNN